MLQIKSWHCYKCHQDFEDLEHDTVNCIERVEKNRDGGAMSCGKLTEDKCEFSKEKRYLKNAKDMKEECKSPL